MYYELRIKLGRKVVFSKIGTLEDCVEWIKLWQTSPSLLDCSYIYSLYPRIQ
jgi:hypothetical protein